MIYVPDTSNSKVNTSVVITMSERRFHVGCLKDTKLTLKILLKHARKNTFKFVVSIEQLAEYLAHL